MKGFSWNRFKTGDIVVHCDTEAKANNFLTEAFEHRLTLLGESHLFDNLYADELENTCYRAGDDGDIWHSSLQFYCENNYKIIEWEVNEMKEFTEEDLKVGMLVKTKNCQASEYGMIVQSIKDGVAVVYKDETWEAIEFLSIVEVWGYSHYSYKALRFSPADRELLYKREEPKKMTVKEICKELGYDVEIVKE